MKFIRLFISVGLLLTVNVQDGLSQDWNQTEIANTVSIGYPTGAYNDSYLGIYIGYNMEIARKDRFSWEGQASVSYISLAENVNDAYALNLLFGPRFYLMKPEGKVRLCFSFLPGVSRVTEEIYLRWTSGGSSLTTMQTFKLGYSVGGYLQFKELMVLGAAFEQNGTLVFKLGYKIPN